jgi:hypothetical protein
VPISYEVIVLDIEVYNFAVLLTEALEYIKGFNFTSLCILIRPCRKRNKISLGVWGRFTSAELLSVSISIMVVWVWIMTGKI